MKSLWILTCAVLVAVSTWLVLRESTPAPPVEPKTSQPATRAAPSALDSSLETPARMNASEVSDAQAEQDTPEPKPADTRRKLRVLLDTGEPVHDARVVLCDPDWRDDSWTSSPTHAEDRTDADGRVQFAVEPRLSLAIVAAPGHIPVIAELDSITEERVIRLDTTLSLAGSARIDGRSPERRIRMVLRGFRDRTSSWPPAAQWILPDMKLGGSRLHIATDEAGAFAVYGLPRGEVLTLEVSPELRLLHPPVPTRPRQTTVSTPARDLQLDLTHLPVVMGQPISGPLDSFPGNIRLAYRFEMSNGRVRKGTTLTSTERPFALPFPEIDLARVQLLFSTEGGERVASRAVLGPLTGSHDFGDIPLERTQVTLHLVVIDPTGAGIEDARAMASKRISEPTDAQGRTSLGLPEPGTPLHVGAFGFELSRITPPLEPPNPFVVTLQPANRLRVVVVEESGAPPRGLMVLVHLGGPHDEDAPEFNGEFARVHGPPPDAGEWSDSERTHYYNVGKTGIFERCDLPTDGPFEVTINDRYDNELGRQTIEMSPGETRVVRFALTHPARTVAGRMLDDAEQPIKGGTASLGGWFGEVTSDEEGHFRLPDLYSPDPTLFLSAEGYATLTLSGREVFERETFTLEPARTVWVEVVDANGQRAEATASLHLEDGAVLHGSQRGVGLYQVDGVPLRHAVARARSDAGSTGEALLETDTTEIRVQLDD